MIGLTIAPQKTEAVMIASKRSKVPKIFSVGEGIVETKESVK